MKIYQIDAFTDQLFGGNPAAVCPLAEWIPEAQMQKIALENNLSETAFFIEKDKEFHIRWFTPEMEIDLCGHATLAAAHVIFNYLNFARDTIHFRYGGGSLFVRKDKDYLCMDFPAIASERTDVTEQMTLCLGRKPTEAFKARDLMVVFKSESDVIKLDPDFARMLDIPHLGIIVTAPGDEVDFVSRFFAPRAGINEDPVTGSAHCMLIPFWAMRLGRNKMKAIQLSKRIGKLNCEFKGQRVEIAGKAVTYMTGDIHI